MWGIRKLMTLPLIALLLSLVLLVWSADRFVEGTASTAKHLNIPPLLIGMVIVGFGTSAPEMMVSVLSSYQGNPGIALGNAYGSNITNIALVLGLSALVNPIAVHSGILRKELPILTLVTGLAAYLIRDGELTRLDGIVLLGVFALLMVWTVWQGLKKSSDSLAEEVEHELEEHDLPLRASVAWLFAGLVLLIVSSRILVWGAVSIARGFGVSDLIIGLTEIGRASCRERVS
jgi:cation:H+ antiporter